MLLIEVTRNMEKREANSWSPGNYGSTLDQLRYSREQNEEAHAFPKKANMQKGILNVLGGLSTTTAHFDALIKKQSGMIIKNICLLAKNVPASLF
ncbi:hypothetical protein TNCV_51601 [Trichonephila clavipes]|nr:hypothetical protein TNCV_51601 [Trichonephila clavipes]